jgi:hypothetical protein
LEPKREEEVDRAATTFKRNSNTSKATDPSYRATLVETVGQFESSFPGRFPVVTIGSQEGEPHINTAAIVQAFLRDDITEVVRLNILPVSVVPVVKKKTKAVKKTGAATRKTKSSSKPAGEPVNVFELADWKHILLLDDKMLEKLLESFTQLRGSKQVSFNATSPL